MFLQKDRAMYINPFLSTNHDVLNLAHTQCISICYINFLFPFLQATLCDATPVWTPIMTTATDKAPNLVPATLMPALQWWAMTVSPTVTVEWPFFY